MENITSWSDVPIVFDVSTASQILGVNIDTIKKYCQSGKLPAFKIDKEWRFEKETFIAYITPSIGRKPLE